MHPDYFDALRACLAEQADASPDEQLQILVEQALDQVPLPGCGETLLRWRSLALVAEHNLSLTKLFEGHTDALAILAELHAAALAPPYSRWGVWAADPPDNRPQLTKTNIDSVAESEIGTPYLLTGRKSWCSGAASLTHALVTAWMDGDGPYLVAVALNQPGIVVTRDGWHAVGMHGSGSVDVVFDAARVQLIGRCASYLARPGFWHGGAGIAACWFGGAVGLARQLYAKADTRPEPLLDTALGTVDTALAQAAALLRESAACIDHAPEQDSRLLALRCRAAAEAAATLTLQVAGRALGATPYCRNAWFARQVADLPVFLRQSHGDRDLAALGAGIVEQASPAWQL